MARKRRAPSPPPQESSTDFDSDNDDEEELRRAAAAQKPPQNTQPHQAAAATDGAESSGDESDSDTDAHAFQVRPVSGIPTEYDGDGEEKEGESSESEPEVPEPVQKKAAATKKSKTRELEDKKRPASEPAPSGNAKKAKAEAGKMAPEAISPGKGKKTNAEPEKTAPEQTLSDKAKKPRGKRGLDLSPSSKSEKPSGASHTWSTEDSIKILEAIAAHVKSEAALPKTDVIVSAVRDRLDRKDCSYTDMYEKVRRLRERYEKAVRTSVVPSEEDELRMYNLSEAIWGENGKEAISAAASQNDSTVKKTKKGQAKKERMDGNSKGGTLKEVANQHGDTHNGSKKGHAIEVKADRDVKSKQGNGKEELGKHTKSKTSKETTTLATQNGDAVTKRKSGKMGKDKMNMDLVPKEASTGRQNGDTRTEEETHQEETEIGASVQGSKETTTPATQNGDAVTKHNSGKMGKDKMNIDLIPKEASTGNQNSGTRTEEETHQEETEIGAIVQGSRRSFDELQELYPSLAGHVEMIEAQHPCGETLKGAFEFIGDEKANALESKIKSQRLLELKAHIRLADLKKEVVKMLIGLMD